MSALFPAAIKELRGRSHEHLTDDQLDKVDALGIDADARAWRISAVLANGRKVLLGLVSRDMKRLFRALQRLQDERFIVFDSGTDRVLLNLSHVLSCRFLYDVPLPGSILTTDHIEEDGWFVHITFAAPHLEPPRFEVEQDTPVRDDLAKVADVFSMAELEDGSSSFVARLTDVDGEDAFLQMSAVAMLTAPLVVVEPNLDAEFDEDDAG